MNKYFGKNFNLFLTSYVNWRNNIKYTMDLGENLIPHKNEKTLVERDLEIILSSGLKWANQSVKATKAIEQIIQGGRGGL